MEALLVLLGLAGLLGLLGGLIGFFKLLSESSEKTALKHRLEAIEYQLKQLQDSMGRLHVDSPTATVSPASAPPANAPAVTEPASAMASASLQQHIANSTLPVKEDMERQRQQPAITPSSTIAAKPVDSEADAKPEASAQAGAALPVSHPANSASNPSNNPSSNPWQPVSQEPTLLEKGLMAAKNWLFGGNTLVRSGIVILFIGISFLLKYAAEHTQVPIELRLTAIALSGIALLAFGWHLRKTRAEYSWAIQGGGVGILYLTIFAALKLYQLIPPQWAFMLLILVAFLSALIAVLQSAMPLALLGFAGGFIAPILTSSGHGSHVGLFSYYLVLNLGIAFVAYHKSWRPLNVLGFLFTFVIGSLWGSQSYIPELFASTEPFLILHFLLFTLIAVLYAFRQSTKVTDYVDATLVFGTPLVGFSLQYALLHGMDGGTAAASAYAQFGLAYSALALAVFYICLAWWVLTRQHSKIRFLGECFLALGVGFVTLTLPLALDGRWTSAAWAVEGVGLVWVGLRQRRHFPLLAGLALQLLGAAAFAHGWGITTSIPGQQASSINENMFLGVAFIALSGWACGALLARYGADKKSLAAKLGMVSTLLALWGWLWWVAAGFCAIEQFRQPAIHAHGRLMFVAVTSGLLPYFARALRWQRLAALGGLLLPVMAIAAVVDIVAVSPTVHPFSNKGWLAWPLAFAVHAWLLHTDVLKPGAVMRAPALWLAALLGVMEWRFWIYQYVSGADVSKAYTPETYFPEALPDSSVWMDVGWAIVPAMLMAPVMFSRKHTHAQAAASANNNRAWLWYGCAPIAVFLATWFLWMSLYSSGNAYPLPYLPLLSPLDIALATVLLLLLIWKREVTLTTYSGSASHMLKTIAPPLAGLMGFALLNGMLLRTLHYWAATPFSWTAILDNTLVKVAFTLVWSITALILMLLAHRKANRRLWIVGASLMGLVVLKLFLLDLAEHGSVERIVSFIGAGVLLLVMGYFAPLPPARLAAKSEVNYA